MRHGYVTLASGLRLEYAESGRGAPLVFLHGYGDSHRSWAYVIERLPPGLHALAPSVRGHGDSDRPPTGYGPETLAEDLREFLDAMGVGRAAIVAHSGGGPPALQLAIEHPERVAGLVLEATGARPRSAVLRDLWQSQVRLLRDPVDPSFVESFQRSMEVRPIPEDAMRGFIAESRKLPAHVWRDYLDRLLHFDVTARLGEIRAPTRILWGDRDDVFEREEVEELAAGITGATLRVYPGAGHALHWEDPGGIAAEIAAFVAAEAGAAHPP